MNKFEQRPRTWKCNWHSVAILNRIKESKAVKSKYVDITVYDTHKKYKTVFKFLFVQILRYGLLQSLVMGQINFLHSYIAACGR